MARRALDTGHQGSAVCDGDLLAPFAPLRVAGVVRVLGAVLRHAPLGAEATLALMAVAFVPWLAGGCLLSPLPDTRTPTDFARGLDGRCASFSEESTEPMRAAAVVESVEPGYSFVSSASMDRQAILRGARLQLRPVPGLSPESLQRALECHQAGVVLGKARAPPNDPYTLPGEWLEVEAASKGDGFVVDVRAAARPQAQLVLDRARRFIAGRR